ncbi:MAG: family 16 glycoside hydrolase, partial [Candidatus Thermoplasmatota archaeon]
VSSFSKGGRPALVFRWQDSDNFYLFRIVGPGTSGNTTDLIKNVAGVLGTLGSAAFTVNIGQWYKLKVTAQGPSIKCYIDDKLVITAVDDKFASGNIVLSCNEGECWFDDIWVNETVETTENIVYYNKQTVAENLALNATKALTWNYDFAKEGEYFINVKTLLQSDKNPANDRKTVRIVVNASAGFIYNLKLGWNYICLAFNNSTITKASELANAIGGNCTKVGNWTGSAFVIYDRVTATNDFTLELGRGYLVWILNGTTKFKLTGSSLASATLQLNPGWNGIGRFTSSITKASELATNIQNCSAIAYWDDALKRFVLYTPGTGFYDFNLERGKGYLVYVTSSSSWVNK